MTKHIPTWVQEYAKEQNRWLSVEEIGQKVGLETELISRIARQLVIDRKLSYFINYKGQRRYAYLPEMLGVQIGRDAW